MIPKQLLNYQHWQGNEPDLVTALQDFEHLELLLEADLQCKPTKEKVAFFLDTVETKAEIQKALYLLGIDIF